MARRCGQPGVARYRRTLVAAAAVVLLCGTGCTSRFTARTEYLAPGFTRASLRGQTVAVVPAAATAPRAGDVGAHDEELAGVARGMREAGARIVSVGEGESTDGTPEPLAAGAGGDLAWAGEFPASPVSLREAARQWGQGVDTTYLLVVRVTRADTYRAYAARGSAASHTSGRRVGVRLALLRLPDGGPVWLAGGTGEAWRTKTAPGSDGAAPAGTLEQDVEGGSLGLYPPPPDPRALARRLTRRLLADVPFPIEVEPN